jgi:hypothetical protein
MAVEFVEASCDKTRGRFRLKRFHWVRGKLIRKFELKMFTAISTRLSCMAGKTIWDILVSAGVPAPGGDFFENGTYFASGTSVAPGR